jgi:7-cyano-7-deazaguanine synthase in queuosine biosynthesis
MGIPDRTPLFFKAITDLLVVLGKRVLVNTPWWGHDKTDMVSWYLNQQDALPTRLKSTHSCYRPGILPCGDCPACIRRYIAMTLNDVQEEYEIDPRMSKTAKEYVRRAKEGTYYSADRNYKTLLALEVPDETE